MIQNSKEFTSLKKAFIDLSMMLLKDPKRK